jgi:hypothetical protein
MLEEMPSHAFTEWMAYYSIEPFGDEVTDIHLARMTAILFNQSRGKAQKAMKPEEFRLWKQVKEKFDAGEFFEKMKDALRR